MALEVELDDDKELTEEMVRRLEWQEAHEVASDLQGHLPRPVDVPVGLMQIHWEAEDSVEEDEEAGVVGGTVTSYLARRYVEIDDELDLYNLVKHDLEAMSTEELNQWVSVARPIARAAAERAGAIPLASVLVD